MARVLSIEVALRPFFKHGCVVLDQTRKILKGYITSMYVTRDGFRVLAQLPARTLTKMRYSAPPFGIDVFDGLLEGLILAEVEFDSAEAAEAFVAPSFAVAEVTTDERFTGGRLARATREDINSWLLEQGLRIGGIKGSVSA